MKKFNIQEALAGKPVILVTTIDRPTKHERVQLTPMPIPLNDELVYYVQSRDNAHYGWGRGLFTADGLRANGEKNDHLEMAPVKKSGYLMLVARIDFPHYRSSIYRDTTKKLEEFLTSIAGSFKQLGQPVSIEWEE